MPNFTIRLLDTPEDMRLVEELQRQVWPGSETDVVPLHVLITAVHNGGVLLGAFQEEKIIGFVWGFPGLEETPDGPRAKHCSHMMGIHPDHRDGGIGFALKRAQWQMVRHQGLDHITWTYDPLLSRNAHLNIAKLGAVCTTYKRSEYGEMRDGINAGLPSDRFQVDWWLNSQRVQRRLGKRARPTLNLRSVTQSGLRNFYALPPSTDNLPHPPEHVPPFEDRLLLAEIPSDFMDLKNRDFALARDWRFFTRELFETAFASNFIITDFVYDNTGTNPRSMYILTHGESTLDEFE
ncbi:MAG TPA: GNAT family N-acetyltransferase [Anaerolineales bacterium]|nr:GNAT family N-acetyltransferase [Anaerolineales bacterium]HNN14071.1 GNAT family N-acetyltransferase [Anaerolineales bacterium]HNO32136.1 GNAT family N-acetyltransferase [Anaerolineales bacterium]